LAEKSLRSPGPAPLPRCLLAGNPCRVAAVDPRVDDIDRKVDIEDVRAKEALVRRDRPGSDDGGDRLTPGGCEVACPAVRSRSQRRPDQMPAAISARDALGLDQRPQLQVTAEVVGAEHHRTRRQNPKDP